MIPPPCMPIEMPDLRNGLIAKWGSDKTWRVAEQQSMKVFADTSLELLNDTSAVMGWTRSQWNEGLTQSIRSHIESLTEAELYWVGPEMCDLLYATAPKVPPDVEPDHLVIPARSGLVVFSKPWEGIDARRVTAYGKGLAEVNVVTDPAFTPEEGDMALASHVVDSDAMAWCFALSKDTSHAYSAQEYHKVISIIHYRCIQWEHGLTPTETELVMAMGLDTNVPKGTAIGPDGRLYSLPRGKTWMPLGRSSWPIGDRVDSFITAAAEYEDECDHTDCEPRFHEKEKIYAESCAEDRRLLSALFTLLNTASMTTVEETHMPRYIARRDMRDRGTTEPSKVRVVYLRRPKYEEHEHTEEHHQVNWSHRWISSAHMRNQPYGPGRLQRRLQMIPACVKGPADKPIVVKETVKAWVR